MSGVFKLDHLQPEVDWQNRIQMVYVIAATLQSSRIRLRTMTGVPLSYYRIAR